ncbi:MAG: acyl-CoA thioesterase [Tissierellia bacterium]|nr:acyl-CoA thioesterase [Tissierellia bacterium]
METLSSTYLVRFEHLNQYQTLFVGPVMGWMDEVGYITAIRTLGLKNNSLVCFAANNVVYGAEIQNGSVLEFTGRVVKLGNTSVTVYVEGSTEEGKRNISGFFTYVHLDVETREKTPHGKVLDDTTNPREMELRKIANSL